MTIGIHHNSSGFNRQWITYCNDHAIPYKLVDCYGNDIVTQLEDCDALMWHFHHANSKDVLFAKQLIYSLEGAGKVVFPNRSTMWHFDDKIAQKYLLESVGAPLVPTFVFYDKEDALQWATHSDFPKVFKLRGGAGASNVQLVENERRAKQLIRKAFGRGFSQYNALSNLKERWRRYKKGLTSTGDLIKGLIRFGYSTDFSKVKGNERGYAYFQKLVSGLVCDFRLKVVENRCWGYRRVVRENDFRASGSGKFIYSKEDIPVEMVRLAFELTDKLQLQSVAYDFVIDESGHIFVLELSYGFGLDREQFYGYWDKNLEWHDGPFNPFGWMVEGVLDKIEFGETVGSDIN